MLVLVLFVPEHIACGVDEQSAAIAPRGRSWMLDSFFWGDYLRAVAFIVTVFYKAMSSFKVLPVRIGTWYSCSILYHH